LRSYNARKEKRSIEDILKTTRSTRRIRTEMSLGIKWMVYMLDEENYKKYSRKGINKIVTEFYQML